MLRGVPASAVHRAADQIAHLIGSRDRHCCRGRTTDQPRPGWAPLKQRAERAKPPSKQRLACGADCRRLRPTLARGRKRLGIHDARLAQCPGRRAYLHSGGPGNAKHIYVTQRRLHAGVPNWYSAEWFDQGIPQLTVQPGGCGKWAMKKVEPVHRRLV